MHQALHLMQLGLSFSGKNLLSPLLPLQGGRGNLACLLQQVGGFGHCRYDIRVEIDGRLAGFAFREAGGDLFAVAVQCFVWPINFGKDFCKLRVFRGGLLPGVAVEEFPQPTESGVERNLQRTVPGNNR